MKPINRTAITVIPKQPYIVFMGVIPAGFYFGVRYYVFEQITNSMLSNSIVLMFIIAAFGFGYAKG